MEDVLDVYARPYDRARPLICFDEKRKELHGTPRGELGPLPGKVAKRDYEYARNGTASLFLWLEPLAARRGVMVSERHTGYDLAGFLKHLSDDLYPEAERLLIVCDNLKTHGPACLYERFEPEEARRIAKRLEWHYTPEHGSWLNVAEVELSVLSRQCLSRRIPDRETLEREVVAWELKRNDRATVVNWQFTTVDARTKLKRLYPKLGYRN